MTETGNALEGPRPTKATVQTLAQEAKAHRTPQLADYLKESGREVHELYRASSSWTTILRRAGLAPDSPLRSPCQNRLSQAYWMIH
ncbi:hypothetical protein [Streptomyces sp. NPDC047453]|uniref:hypothetical protein n=1 Tax=Streptomyces sp. NPDC047453 TaxID=3154812 RepID=UPI0033C6D1A4